MKKDSKIYIAGHNGMVGSAILRNLESKGYTNFVFTPWPEYDLTVQKTVQDFFAKEKPEYVIDAAAKVGGILANDTYRAQFIYENLMIQNNLIHISYVHKVKKLLFLGSSCIYPKNCPQPMKEEYLLTGLLEPTNEPYAIAKIAGIKMCENYNRQYGTNFISVMPTNLYGPNDNFDLEKSHVLPALIRKIHLGKCLEENNWMALREDLNKRPIEGVNGDNSKDEILHILSNYGIVISQVTSHKSQVTVEIWGSGKPMREFLWSEDLADAIFYLMNKVEAKDLYDNNLTHINIGTGEDLSIAELVEIVKNVVGFQGLIKYDKTKPDGTPRKLMDVSRLHNLGWKHSTGLEEGIKKAYSWYLENEDAFRK